MRQEAREWADWQTIDHALREIARRRAALDVEEARWLREAERLQIWKRLGMVSALDYCERILGYAPHTAKERLRVARALGQLPQLEQAFACGQLAFSAVRELTRVATPENEHDWLEASIGKTLREIEESVVGLRHGDGPKDPRDPQARIHKATFELRAEVFARLRQTRAALGDAHGRFFDDDELFTALCDAVLDRTANATEPNGRAKFQIALRVCPKCDRASQEGAGAIVPIDATALDRARCDAQHIGSLDGDAPERAYQDIPPSVVRFVWRRDGGRCQTRGCRSTIGLEIHHDTPRVEGGDHHPSNLGLRCSSCHLAIHRGELVCTAAGVTRPNEPRNENAELPVQARDALVALGWKVTVARTAVDEAWSHVGPETTIESLIREALRRCPKPSS